VKYSEGHLDDVMSSFFRVGFIVGLGVGLSVGLGVGIAVAIAVFFKNLVPSVWLSLILSVSG
jgi:hypothetical protein